MEDATRKVIDCFERINRIPRCSKHEAQISRWLQAWAAERKFPVQQDDAGNLVIRVPASPGWEAAPIVILQGHMDMVCEKNPASEHDFSKDPIRMRIDGDWLGAVETTLGADNGIAIALALALVDDPAVRHPPLELYFTVDEETGLTGVLKMDPALLTGRILLNLDSEDEGVFVVGCAGGRGTTLKRPLSLQPLPRGGERLRIAATGMRGGHSGVDIAKHRANANKVMARLLGAGLSAATLNLLELKGGTGRNVIPRACEALVVCAPGGVAAVRAAVNDLADVISSEYKATEPGLAISIAAEGTVPDGDHAVSEADTAAVIDLLMALPSGPVEMDPDFPLLVRTSVNLSMVSVASASLEVVCSERSSVTSRLDALCCSVEAVGRLAGARAETGEGYPSWPMDPDSALLERVRTCYRELFGEAPDVRVMHAGLECGVIGERCPGMDMISLGPTVENPHSPSERLHLPSVEKVWRLLAALLGAFEPAAGE